MQLEVLKRLAGSHFACLCASHPQLAPETKVHWFHCPTLNGAQVRFYCRAPGHEILLLDGEVLLEELCEDLLRDGHQPAATPRTCDQAKDGAPEALSVSVTLQVVRNFIGAQMPIQSNHQAG